MKMTDVTQEQQNDVEVNEVELLRQQLADAQKSIEALASKKDELLKETKAAKEEKRKQSELADKAKQAELEAAAKNGEFEKLHKHALEELEKERAERLADRKRNRNAAIENEALKIAVDLAKDDKKAALLKEFVAKSLGNVADDYGQVEQDVLKSVRQQFETDDLYSSLRAGNLSVGGGAPGNNKSGNSSGVREMTQREVDSLPPAQKVELLMSGKIKVTPNK